METKFASFLHLLAFLAFSAIWVILLFVGEPHVGSKLESAKNILTYTLTGPESVYFFMFIASMVVCLVSCVLLFFKKYTIQVMYVNVLHSLIALVVYDFSLVVAVSLPLLLFGQVKSAHNQAKQAGTS